MPAAEVTTADSMTAEGVAEAKTGSTIVDDISSAMTIIASGLTMTVSGLMIADITPVSMTVGTTADEGDDSWLKTLIDTMSQATAIAAWLFCV